MGREISELNLKILADQLKGQIYDELPQTIKWQVTIYSGNPNEKNWKRSYPVRDRVMGYVLREALYRELLAFGILNNMFIIIHLECFNPNIPEEGWFEWFDSKGNDIDLFEVDENFNIYLLEW